MDRTKIIEAAGESYKLSAPTMRTNILIESQVASLTRGSAQILALASSASAVKALDNAYKLARLDALVVKQRKVVNGFQDDFTFSFFDLPEDEQGLVDEISKQLDEFIDSFRKPDASPEQV